MLACAVVFGYPVAASLIAIAAGHPQIEWQSDLLMFSRFLGSAFVCLGTLKLIPNAKQVVLFLRSFASDSSAEHTRLLAFLKAALAPKYLVQGICPPAKRLHYLLNVGSTPASLLYVDSPSFSLIAPEKAWLAGVAKTLARKQTRAVIIDLRGAKENVYNEVELCLRFVGPKRILFVLDNTDEIPELLVERCENCRVAIEELNLVDQSVEHQAPKVREWVEEVEKSGVSLSLSDLEFVAKRSKLGNFVDLICVPVGFASVFIVVCSAIVVALFVMLPKGVALTIEYGSFAVLFLIAWSRSRKQEHYARMMGGAANRRLEVAMILFVVGGVLVVASHAFSV